MPPKNDPVYEQTGPAILSDAPPEPKRRKSDPTWNYARSKMEERMTALRNWRNSWLQHWALCAAYVLPRRSMWLAQGALTQPTPNSMTRGLPINSEIIDETGTQAMRICAAGLMSGLTSESRPWFKLGVWRKGIPPEQDAKRWLEAVEEVLYDIMAGSNFYAQVMQQDEDLVTFGTAPMIIYEDPVDVIRCYNPVVGEYYLSNSASMRPETFMRLFVLTCSQIVEWFGLENCPEDIVGLWRTKGATLEQERIVAHCIEPNYDIGTAKGSIRLVSDQWPIREAYWVWGTASDGALSLRGFDESPVCCPRWATQGNDAYGRSPVMDALPSIMQLQVEQSRLLEAIEKQVRPPLIADMRMKELPSSALPGHVTFVPDLANGGMKPMYTVLPNVADMVQNIQDCRVRVQKTLYNDILLMISEQQKDMTAFEVAKRNEEKLQVLGPVIQRLQNENLKPAITRIYRIAARARLLPPPPDSMRGAPLNIEYISILSLAQKAAETAGMERYAKTAIDMAAGGLPDALLTVDPIGYMKKYGDSLGVPVEGTRSDRDIVALKKAQAQQRAQAQTLQAGMGAAKAAGDVGLDVGGGLNAIAAMTGQPVGRAA